MAVTGFKTRIFALLLISVSVFLFPLPVSLGLFIVAVAVLPNFYEGVVSGVFFDSLYYSPAQLESLDLGFFTVSFVVFVFLINRSKKLMDPKSIVSKLAFVSAGPLYFFALFFLFNNVF